jgi:zinc transporter
LENKIDTKQRIVTPNHNALLYSNIAQSTGLVWAYDFDTSGHVKPIDVEKPPKLSKPKGAFHWLHFDLVDARAIAWCEAQANLPREVWQILHDRDASPRLYVEAGLLCGMLPDFARNSDSRNAEPSYLHVVMAKNWIVTGRRHPLQGIRNLRDNLVKGQVIATPAALLEAMVNSHIADVAKLIQDIAKQTDTIEDRIISRSDTAGTAEIGGLRRKIVTIHRELKQLHTIFRDIKHDDKAEKVYEGLEELVTRTDRKVEMLNDEIHAIQDRARLLQEETSALVAASINNSLYIISLISALLLPPSVIFGMFGMNVGGVPLIAEPTGFIIVTLAAIASSAFVYWLLRRQRKRT